MSIELINEEAFDALPVNKPLQKSDDFWEPIIDALADHKIVRIPFATETEKRGRRLAAGRRAKKAGFTIEIRYGDDFLAIRRTNESGDKA